MRILNPLSDCSVPEIVVDLIEQRLSSNEEASVNLVGSRRMGIVDTEVGLHAGTRLRQGAMPDGQISEELCFVQAGSLEAEQADL